MMELTDKDIEIMRECVREYDEEKQDLKNRRNLRHAEIMRAVMHSPAMFASRYQGNWSWDNVLATIADVIVAAEESKGEL